MSRIESRLKAVEARMPMKKEAREVEIRIIHSREEAKAEMTPEQENLLEQYRAAHPAKSGEFRVLIVDGLKVCDGADRQRAQAHHEQEPNP
jgi:hypothetical protein